LKVLGKDADFLYDTIEKYIKDAETANKPELVKIWQTIKEDRKRHLHLFKKHWKKKFTNKFLAIVQANGTFATSFL
jgi:translation elongation factor EF-1alpha